MSLYGDEQPEQPESLDVIRKRRELYEKKEREAAEQQKIAEKTKLRNQAEALFAKIEADYVSDREQVESLKSQLVSAIEDVYKSKQVGILSIEETKGEILSAMKATFDELSSRFDQKMQIADDLIKLLTTLQTTLRDALTQTHQEQQQYIQFQKELTEKYNEQVSSLQKQYNMAVSKLNDEIREYNRTR
jgi:hypothetical protein